MQEQNHVKGLQVTAAALHIGKSALAPPAGQKKTKQVIYQVFVLLVCAKVLVNFSFFDFYRT